MKRIALYSLILLTTVACAGKEKGNLASSDQVKTTPPPTQQNTRKAPGAEVTFVVTNVTQGVSYLSPFHLTGDVVVPKSVNVANDLKLFTTNFIPAGKSGLAARFIQEEAGDDTSGTIMGGLGTYESIGSVIDIVVIGDWTTIDLETDRKHLFINLYEDELNFMATSYNLLWPTE